MLVLIIFFNISNIYAGPQWDGLNIRFNENPSEIVMNEYDFLFSTDSLQHINRRNMSFEKISYDVYILHRDNRLNHARHTISTICLNISVHENNEILLLPLFDLAIFEYSIEYRDDQVIIYPTMLAHYNITLDNKKIVLNFDNTLLKHSMIVCRASNDIFEKYEYLYDENQRLINIIAETKDNIKIIRKSIFYDGVFRNIPRPFLHDLITPNTAEIIIFYESTIKYHLAIMRNFIDHRMIELETLEERERAWYYTVFEFNHIGDEIVQSRYYYDGRITRFFTNYLEYDDYNNWIKRQIFSESDNIVGEIIREIRY
jgi:hypothetical protein